MDYQAYESCGLCPRICKVNRYETAGYCGCKTAVKAARAALHHWEEPCISGFRGSGAVFFSGCTLRCCYCQNYPISCEGFGKELTDGELADVFLRLQEAGAHNLNLVTATQYLPSVIHALDLVKHRLSIPVVYNCGGYERVGTIRALDGYVDIWLPDLKYQSNGLAARYSQAPDYFEHASRAVRQMIAQAGAPCFTAVAYPEGGAEPQAPGQPIRLMTKGVIIRHMVLPGAKEDSIRLLHWMKETLPERQYYVSLLSQYTPFYRSGEHPEINRRITSYEYDRVVDTAIELGLLDGFMQKKSSAKEEYTPPFDLEGL